MNPALSYSTPAMGTLTVYTGISPVSLGGDSIGGSIVANTRAPEFAEPGQGRLLKGEVGAFFAATTTPVAAMPRSLTPLKTSA